MAHAPRQRGFVLLLILLVVAIAAAALGSLARHSALSAVHAQQDVEQLQRKWAVITCRATLLPLAPRLFAQAEGRVEADDNGSEDTPNSPQPPVPSLDIVCDLLGGEYRILLTDEQAKLNVNAWLPQVGRAKLSGMVEELIPRGAARGVRAELRPMVIGRQAGKALGPAIGSYGQIFPGVSPDALVGQVGVPGAAAAVTCWGNGRIHVARADAAVLEMLCAMTIGRPHGRRLRQARDRNPYAKLEALLASVERIDDRQRTELQPCLTDESECYGLWIVTRRQTRSFYTFSVGLVRPTGQEDVAYRVAQRLDYQW